MKNIITFLQGKKTYILMGCAIIYAICGFISGNLNSGDMINIIWVALSGAAVRNAL
jgi:hypothetical protein